MWEIQLLTLQIMFEVSEERKEVIQKRKNSGLIKKEGKGY
jgi:hypothetical protein